MNDRDASEEIALLKAEHRRLDEQIRALAESGGGNQIEVARLKKRKLRLKDQIQLLLDSSVPDIIA